MSDYAVILSARMSSTRLPGKPLVSYCPDGTPNLLQIYHRWQASKRNPTIVIATSTYSDDNAIAELCRKRNIACYRGPRDDVVTRMDNALKEFAPDSKYVARALADNPLVDVDLADWRYDVLCETGADGLYYGGQESRITYAGTTDVWNRAAWDRIAELSQGEQREHPGAHYWDHIAKFSAVQLPLPRREYIAPFRTELDTAEDLEMFGLLWRYTDCRDTLLALQFLDDHPEVAMINAHVEVKTQSRPSYGRGSAFVCRDCQSRTGTVDNGNLILRCSRCGRPQKFYNQKPIKPSMMRY